MGKIVFYLKMINPNIIVYLQMIMYNISDEVGVKSSF